MALRYFCIGLVFLLGGQVWAAEVALVMSLQGKVTRLGEAMPTALETYAKLKDGDRLGLDKDSRLQLLYFDNGRQESWAGPGRLEVTAREGKGIGLPLPDARTLPVVMARQLARTPSPDNRGGVTRSRAVPAPDAMSRLEDTYQDLRSRTGRDDLGPEMYLLSGLFEMRELDRVERVLGDLQQDGPKTAEAALLLSLYRKAVRNAREGRK